MSVVTYQSGNTVKFEGRIVGDQRALLDAAISKIFDAGDSEVIFDLSEAEFLDSSALGSIVAAFKLCKTKGGNLQVTGASATVREIFNVTGLAPILNL